MANEKIYAIYPSNDNAFVDLREPKERQPAEQFNVREMFPKWNSKDYKFYSPGKRPLPSPNATILVGGALAIKANLKDSLFIHLSNHLEFLPIRVEEENWLIVNCLELESNYNGDDSVVYRGQDGKIFMVVHLVLEAEKCRHAEIFVIQDSNRATIFARQAFVDRFIELNLQGLIFREVGKLKVDVSG